MSSGFEPINLEQIAAVKANAEKEKKEKKPRRKKDLSEDRTYTGWFKLRHFVGQGPGYTCVVPSHDEQETERTRPVAHIDGIAVCRYCFLAQRDKQMTEEEKAPLRVEEENV